MTPNRLSVLQKSNNGHGKHPLLEQIVLYAVQKIHCIILETKEHVLGGKLLGQAFVKQKCQQAGQHRLDHIPDQKRCYRAEKSRLQGHSLRDAHHNNAK